MFAEKIKCFQQHFFLYLEKSFKMYKVSYTLYNVFLKSYFNKRIIIIIFCIRNLYNKKLKRYNVMNRPLFYFRKKVYDILSQIKKLKKCRDICMFIFFNQSLHFYLPDTSGFQLLLLNENNFFSLSQILDFFSSCSNLRPQLRHLFSTFLQYFLITFFIIFYFQLCK